MADIFRLKNEDGSDGNWGFFSEAKGEIVDAGPDEAAAKEQAQGQTPQTTIAQALVGDATQTTPAAEPAATPAVEATPVNDTESKSETVTASPPALTLIAGGGSSPATSATVTEKKKRAPLSPQFIKKIVEQLAKNSCNLSIELERFLIKWFGFSTEELSEDDEDVQIIKMGWDCIWQECLAGNDPPIWMILAFGYSCVTARLIASAKRIPKKEVEKEAANE